jgi:hypothetical protein
MARPFSGLYKELTFFTDESKPNKRKGAGQGRTPVVESIMSISIKATPHNPPSASPGKFAL